MSKGHFEGERVLMTFPLLKWLRTSKILYRLHDFAYTISTIFQGLYPGPPQAPSVLGPRRKYSLGEVPIVPVSRNDHWSRHGRYVMTTISTVRRNAPSTYNYGSVGPSNACNQLLGPRPCRSILLWPQYKKNSNTGMTVLLMTTV